MAYASTLGYRTDEEYIDLALKCREKGFKALKIHPYKDPKKDIPLCKAVWEAVGESMILMLDSGPYTRDWAPKVGREIDKLNFYWFEDPLPTTDVDGLVELCRTLEVKILIGEAVHSHCGFAELIRRRATDALRGEGDFIGGITPMVKEAHLAESFHMNWEPHSYGNALHQAAHLHVALAIENADFHELPVPDGLFDVGMKEGIRIDKDGYVHASNKPGLGYDIDWDEIEKITECCINI